MVFTNCRETTVTKIFFQSKIFRIHFKEHLSHRNHNNIRSTNVNHLISINQTHSSIDKNKEILCKGEESTKLNILEEYEIYSHFKSTLTTY